MVVLFEYCPYRINIYFIPFAAISMCILLVMFICIPNLLFLILALILVWTIKNLYKSSRIKFLFCEDGIQIFDNKQRIINGFLWEQLKYGYRGRNYKGHTFFLLTPRELTINQVHKYVNHGANTGKVCIDDIVVFPIEDSKYTPELENFIFSRVIVTVR